MQPIGTNLYTLIILIREKDLASPIIRKIRIIRKRLIATHVVKKAI